MDKKEYGSIHIGWDKIEVYSNEHGDICIAQDSPIEGSTVVICVPLLYIPVFINKISQAVNDHED